MSSEDSYNVGDLLKLLMEERTRREEDEAHRTEEMKRMMEKREKDMQRQVELFTRLVGEKTLEEGRPGVGAKETFQEPFQASP